MEPVGAIGQVMAALAVLAPSPAPGPWATTLDHLDYVRAAAYASGDPARLEGVYTAGSDLAAADAAVMRQWRARGLVLGPVRLRSEQVRVVSATPARVELDVVDRLAPVGARDGDLAVAIPTDGPTRRTIVLEPAADGDGWRIAESRRRAG